MAKIAVFASGRGSNFTAIHRELSKHGHTIAVLVCDRKHAPAIGYAESHEIPVIYAPYPNRSREDVETEIISRLSPYSPRLLVLAGYMRLLSPVLVGAYRNKIINIHPSLLPRHPGTEGIKESWESGDDYLGISIHFVDEGMDSGKIIVQQAFHRSEVKSLEETEERIHELEHFWYPRTVLELLNISSN